MPLFYHMERLHAPHNVRMSHFSVIRNTSIPEMCQKCDYFQAMLAHLPHILEERGGNSREEENTTNPPGVL